MTDQPGRMETLDLDAIRENEGMSHPHVVRMGGREWRFKARVAPDAFFDFLGMDEQTADDRALEVMDTLILRLLVTEHRADWTAARAEESDEGEISLSDMERIITWAMPLVTGRPLERRPDSSPGRPTETTGPASAAASGSQAETPTGLTVAG
jgi:hypothetical protein